MLGKLSKRNAMRQAKDYLIYFITMIISVSLIYAFNGLVFSSEISGLGIMLQSLPAIIVLASIIMVFIIGWLVYYTINFMLHRRSKELATYMMLGIENKQVAGMFFRENLIIGGIALIVGFLGGNFIYQMIRAIIMRLFGRPFHFEFSFSMGAILLTLLYFIIIYLYAMLKCRKRISRMKIYDLLHYEKKNEEKMLDNTKNRKMLFITSILSGIIGLIFIIMAGISIGGSSAVFVGFLFIIYFIYGFFISLSSFIQNYMDKRPQIKYKGNNLFVFRVLTSKISTMSVTMATLSLLFIITVVSIGTGMLLSNLFAARPDQETAYDLEISREGRTDFAKYTQYIEQSGIDIQQSYIYSVYINDSSAITDHLKAVYNNMVLNDYGDSVMAVSDYNYLRNMLGYSSVELEEGKYIIHCIPVAKNNLKEYATENSELKVQNTSLFYQEMHNENFSQYSWGGNGTGFVLVLPDQLVESLPVLHNIYAAMTGDAITHEQYAGLEDLGYGSEAEPNDLIYSKAISKEMYTSSYILMVFPLYYFALILIMVTATTLSIQHLSENSKNRYRYKTLNHLGVDNKGIERTIRKQLAIYYLLPSLPSFIFSSAIICALAGTFDAGIITSVWQIWMFIGISIGLFLIIYMLYIGAAYTSFRRNVMNE